ncbi:sterol desaturase family protein [Sphingobacterium sp. BN32]|uniref:sterol desaturase family protein n=1 Tax=Sphingobacterium sp. BN32 TaxID=3058432 RepID=UPI00265D4029|nr:sterol desaturase family protein [Sphingobacterium sp. BN32]WKK59888.1 sterol desaturase family protein [Sphingobacterium sp. BN32]
MTDFLEQSFQFVLSKWYWTSFFFFVFFSLLYFLGAAITDYLVKRKEPDLKKIVNASKKGQRAKEIRNSLISILVFSIQAILFQQLFAMGIFQVGFDQPWNCLWEIPVLFLWNEVHFYCMHWLLHRKWMIRNVHRVHHWSVEPTAYSIYSFHWVEAFMLGTVIFFPLFVHNFQIYSLLSLPLMSLLVNLLGHCNHELSDESDPSSFSKYTFRHSMHHKYGKGNFGFMLPWIDQLFGTQLPKNNT